MTRQPRDMPKFAELVKGRILWGDLKSWSGVAQGAGRSRKPNPWLYEQVCSMAKPGGERVLRQDSYREGQCIWRWIIASEWATMTGTSMQPPKARAEKYRVSVQD